MPEQSAFSDAAENIILDTLLRNVATGLENTATRWVALVTATVAEASTGANIAEVPHASGYVRGTTNFGASAGGVVTNNAPVRFTATGGSWGTVVGIAILDTAADAAGTVIMFDNSMADVLINDGDSLTFGTNEITCSVF